MKYKKDYYKILGIEPNATPEEIKQAYRRLAIFNHPDKNQTHQATTKMRDINEAYSILNNQSKRANYDSERGNPSTSYNSSSISSDINTTKTESLDQFFSEKPNAGYIVISGMLSVFMVVFLIFAVGILFSSGFRTTWFGIGIIFAGIPLLSLLPVTLGVFFLPSFISRRKEKKCPKCGKAQAAEKMSGNLMGIFQRVAGQASSRNSKDNPSLTYEKYKIHYRCKYCSYEWCYIKAERQ